MSEGSWVLRGVDPETRQSAVAEAERRGLSLADFLTEVVLHKALTEQVSAIAADAATDEPMLRGDSDGFGIRQRLATLERRLATTANALDGAINALDSSLYDVTARLGEAEAFSGSTAETLQQALQDLSGQMAALRLHISDVELNDNVRDEELAERLDDIAAIAQSADRAASELFHAQDALRRAVAGDFAAFTNDTADRIEAGLADVRAAADIAAEQADAAVAHLIVELRGVRETLDRQVVESVEETRARIRAVFAETSARVAGLTERVDENERVLSRTADALQARIIDAEDAAQTALEETAEALRQTDAVLMGELGRTTQDLRAAMIVNREELAADISDLRDGHAAGLARLKLIDVAIGNAFGEIADVRETAALQADDISAIRDAATAQAGEIDARVRSQFAQARAEWSDRLETLFARVIAGEASVIDAHHAVRNEIQRVEACTFASLEKLSGDIVSSETRLGAKLAETTALTQTKLTDAAAAAEEMAARLARHIENETAELREQHAGAAARLKLLEGGLQTLESGAAATDARLRQLDAQIADRSLYDTLAARLSQNERTVDRVEHAVTQNLQDVRSTLDAQAVQIGGATQHAQDIARMLTSISAQAADATAQVETRVHEVEVAIADLRLEAKLAPPVTDAVAGEEFHTALHELHARMAGLEQRQAEAFETLRANISHLVTASEQRLSALETAEPPQPHFDFETLRTDIAAFIDDNGRRLAALEAGGPAPQADVAQQFEDLRRRIEERVLGVELRSVRTMEQVVDAISLIEQRVLSAEDAAEAKSA